MNNLLQILLGLVIAGLIAVLSAPYFIDWNQYRHEIETQASRLLGRELKIAGDVNLRLLPAPYLQLENISVVTIPPERDKAVPPVPLMTASAFRLWLSAPPLLRGIIEVRDIEVVKPHMRLAINENGQNNWSSDPQISPTLPFTPTAISLQSMTITDGTLEISARASKNKAGKNRTLKINSLNGDFSAGSLKGPYKFDGTIGTGARRQILRVSTGSIDDKSQMRVKGVLRSPKGGQRYGFDGAFTDLGSHPTMNGVISAAFPFFRATGKKGATEGKNAKGSPGINRAKPIEVKTSITANSSGALFDKILVTIVHKNRPQALTGKGQLSFDNGRINLDGNLSARLLDVDHLKDGLRVGNSVEETVANLFAGLRVQAAKVDSGRFMIKFNQIKLNGDLVQDLKIDLAQSGKGLIVKKLFARLPGDNMIELSGGFDRRVQDATFTGHGMVRGQSLGHLVTWGAGTKLDDGVAAIRSHPFTLRGDLVLKNGLVALRKVRGDIAGTSFTGEISKRQSKTDAITPDNPSSGMIDLQLTTSEINSTALIGRPVAMGEIVERLLTARPPPQNTPQEKESDAPETSGLAALLRDNALRLQLRAGRLRLDDFDGRDLVVDVFLGPKRLQINQLSLRSQKGLRLQADGTISDLEQSPHGTLTATVNIEDKKELAQILSWSGDRGSALFSQKQISALTPLRLATMLQTTSGAGKEARIRINGIAGSSHISLTNRIVGEHLFSRTGRRSIKQMELSGTLANRDGRLILRQLVPYLPLDPGRLREIGAGKVWFSAAGLPESGLNSRVEFNSKHVSAGLNGLIGWKKEENSSKGQRTGYFNGTVHLKASDIASGLALIGIDVHDSETAGSLDLTALLDKQGNLFDFTTVRGTLASSEIEGRITLKTGNGTGNGAANTKRKLDVVLLTSSLHLPSLFTPLLEKAEPEQAEAREREAEAVTAALQLATRVDQAVGSFEDLQKPVITTRRFSSQLLRDIDAKILITADRLFLADRIMLENAELSARIDRQKIGVNRIRGTLWGGRMQGTGTLDLSATLAQVSGVATLAGFSLEQTPLLVDKSPVANGTATLQTAFSGRGISPAGLFALMNGKGEIRLEKAKINHYSASVLTDIVDDQLSVWNQSEDQSPFKERFKRHLLHADFDLPPVTRKFTIKDGTLLFKTSLGSKQNSRLDVDASLSLSSMITHTRLTISPTKTAKYASIPAASIVYEGSLARLDSITPQIDTASLEQHLKVMKMEHDVDLLEKLHRRDEEFARRAAERRAEYKRRLEAERLEQERLEKERLEALGGNDGLPGREGQPSPAPAGQLNDWVPFGRE